MIINIDLGEGGGGDFQFTKRNSLSGLNLRQLSQWFWPGLSENKILKIKGGFAVKMVQYGGEHRLFYANEYFIVMTMFFELFLLRNISEVPSGTRTHNLLIAGETL